MPVVSIGWSACDWEKIFSRYLYLLKKQTRPELVTWCGQDLIKAIIATYHFGKRNRFLPPKIYDPGKRITKTKKGSKTTRRRSSPYREPLFGHSTFSDLFWLSSVGFVPLSSIAPMDRLASPSQPPVPLIEDPLPDFDEAGIATAWPLSLGVWV